VDFISPGQSQSQQQQQQESKQAAKTKPKEQAKTEEKIVEKQQEQAIDENAVIVEVSEATFEHLVVLSPVPVLLEFYLPRYNFSYESKASIILEYSLCFIQQFSNDN
jgi:hypothetical protein